MTPQNLPEALNTYSYISKHHGQGNDFIIAQEGSTVFEELNSSKQSEFQKSVAQICNRETGIEIGGVKGADGFIQLFDVGNVNPEEKMSDKTRDKNREIFFTLFNADGSFAEVSGNGLRCAGQALARRANQTEIEYKVLAKFKGEVTSTYNIYVKNGTSEISDSRVEFGSLKIQYIDNTRNKNNSMQPLIDIMQNVLSDSLPNISSNSPSSNSALSDSYAMFRVDVGNPHLVFLTQGLEEMGDTSESAEKFEKTARRISEEYQKAGLGEVNIEFVEVLGATSNDGVNSNDGASKNLKIRMKVFERGVGVTQACGSGAVASVAVINSVGLTNIGVFSSVHSKATKPFLRLIKGTLNEVDVVMDGGTATVYFENEVYSLSGPVHFTGKIL